MVPDTPETRIGRLEQEVSALRQKINDVANDVENLDEARMAIVELKVMLTQVEREMSALNRAMRDDRSAAKERGQAMEGQIKELNERLENYQKDQAKQQKETSYQTKLLLVTILVALIGASSTIVGVLIA